MSRLLAAVVCLALLPVPALAAAHGKGVAKAARGASGMITLPAGSYRPLYGRANDPAMQVASFRLDRDPVTRGEFLAFVEREPKWRRTRVRPTFADRERYLASWRGDLDAGGADDLRRPVTGVSWFAARAYCVAQGKRLPTVAEWEYAAAASGTRRDAARESAFVSHLMTVYASRTMPAPRVETAEVNAWGLGGMHDLAWEWVEDFNSVIASDDSRGVGGRDHDLFCASAAIGATDPTNYPAFLRYAVRAGATARSAMDAMGFRCAA